ncbi:ly6/PLAUR domain-containing protein 2-like [Anneissia japonica]|uniref:ly6/PLAUR domain-containing protein 2-like n=1 Tax=Anneissia japonica TaxID=1529436 RepID=UPI0014258AD1|nr:ly6/PLAUR domain-containing protein 2-like [Anneissia japonica]XP_033115289.1 ly6/PLAUR domain-containing protein 2-like [Anneissia japonica]
MDSKFLLLAIAMMYFADVSNALMCYNCTTMTDPSCGETLTNPSNVQQVTCSGICMTAKTSMPMPGGSQGQLMTMYSRSCEVGCYAACIDIQDVQGMTVCTQCCNTDLCNSNYVESGTGGGNTGNNPSNGQGNAQPEPTMPMANDMTTKSSAIKVVVNFAAVLLGFLSVTML